MPDTIRLDTRGAQSLLRSYHLVTGWIDDDRRGLGSPLAEAAALAPSVRELAELVPVRLRALSDLLVADADDLAWRLAYVTAHGSDGVPLQIPDRPARLRSIFSLVAAASDPDADLDEVLAELAFHVVDDPSNASLIAAAFHGAGLLDLQRRVERELAVRAQHVGRIDDVSTYDADAYRRDVEALMGDADQILGSLGILFAAMSRTGDGRRAILDSWDYDDPDEDGDISLMALALSGGVWDERLLLTIGEDIFSDTVQRSAYGTMTVFNNQLVSGIVWPQLLDPHSMVLRALGRNPEAARTWIADHDGFWRALTDDGRDWNLHNQTVYLRQASDRDGGLAALLNGAAVGASPSFIADALVGTYDPSREPRVNDGIFFAIAEHGVPGAESAAAVADLVSMVWPLLAAAERSSAVSVPLAGDALSEIMVHDEALARLLAGFSVHLEATFTEAYSPDRWGSVDPDATDTALQSAYHAFELLDRGLDGVDIDGDRFSLARAAFNTLLGHGAKTGLRAVGAGGGLPGVLLGFGAGELVGFLADSAFPVTRSDTLSSQGLLEDLFVGGDAVYGATERQPSPGQVLLANAAMTAHPTAAAELGDSRFLDGTTIVLPTNPAHLEAFGEWFHEAFEGHERFDDLVFGTSDQLAKDAATVTGDRERS